MGADRAYRRRTIDGHALHPQTLALSYGYDPHLSEGAVKCPIFLTSTFVFRSAAEGKRFFELAYGLRQAGPAEEPGLIYSRINNPDLEILEDRLTLWDGAEAALVFGSGMAAITTTLLAFVRPGTTLVHSAPVYGGTDFLLQRILPQFGVTAVAFGPERTLAEALREATRRGPVVALYVETPANPTNALVDIAACRAAAEELESPTPLGRPLVLVDNTFLGPLWQQPLRHGADLVLYSLTKYVGGHSDVIAGACLGSRALLASVRGMRTICGTMADPHTGWLLMRSLETLRVRLEAQAEGARRVAEFLRDHPRVRRVHYLRFLEPGTPEAELFARQCCGAGATFSFEIDGGEAEAFRVLDALQVIKLAVSLGGTESLAEHPATMTHADISPDEQRRLGITPGMIRLSVGLEHPDDLIADLRQALAA